MIMIMIIIIITIIIIIIKIIVKIKALIISNILSETLIYQSSKNDYRYFPNILSKYCYGQTVQKEWIMKYFNQALSGILLVW